MLHWVWVAFSVYILHATAGAGYQWWSGPGSDLAYVVAVIAPVVALAKHHNCHHKGCKKLGHRHPRFGWPACRAHWNEVPDHMKGMRRP